MSDCSSRDISSALTMPDNMGKSAGTATFVRAARVVQERPTSLAQSADSVPLLINQADSGPDCGSRHSISHSLCSPIRLWQLSLYRRLGSRPNFWFLRISHESAYYVNWYLSSEFLYTAILRCYSPIKLHKDYLKYKLRKTIS